METDFSVPRTQRFQFGDQSRALPHGSVGVGTFLELLESVPVSLQDNGFLHRQFYARLCGYDFDASRVQRSEELHERALPMDLSGLKLPEPESASVREPAPQAISSVKYYARVSGYRRLSDRDIPSGDVPQVIAEADGLSDDELVLPQAGQPNWGAPNGALAQPPPRKQPLMPWSRLDPFLRRVLGRDRVLSKLDTKKAVALLCRLQTPKSFPRIVQRGWAPRAVILVDRDPYLNLFWGDQDALVDRIVLQRGKAGLRIITFPDAESRGWDGDKRDFVDLRRERLESSVPVLLLGDCGRLRPEEQKPTAWQQLGHRLRRQGLSPVALAPCPRDRWPQMPNYPWTMALWDRRGWLPRIPDSGPPAATAPRYSPEDLETRARGLLRLLSWAIRVEPALLREMRFLMSAHLADVGTEADAWHHAMVGAVSADVACLHYNHAVELRSLGVPETGLRHGIDPRAAISSMILRHHTRFSPLMMLEERLNLLDWFGDAEFRAAEESDILRGINRAVRTFTVDGRLSLTRASWVIRISQRLSEAQRQRVPYLAAAYWLAAHYCRRDLLRGALPDGFREEDIVWVQQQIYQKLHLWQGRQALSISEKSPEQCSVRVAVIRSFAGNLVWRDRNYSGRVSLPGSLPDRIEFPCSVENAVEQWQLEKVSRPSWARELGFDCYGLYADLAVRGRDEKEIVQRMRWINPGSFMMGSPKDEPGRLDREGPRHRVTLTRGYWLADTPCTQDFWCAVTGRTNPAYFQSPTRPVEQVSWEDCMETFLPSLTKVVAINETGMKWALPTEAQWEYACRAGADSALYTGPIEILGENWAQALHAISWYGGNSGLNFNLQNGYDCSEWKERQFPEPKQAGTHPVKQKLENGWGLYDIIGNVWEWCADYFQDDAYEGGNVVDPMGPLSGDNRVVRGGSWNYAARFCRSAFRSRFRPDLQISYLGFRFALVGGTE